jgi:hypothetical protein
MGRWGLPRMNIPQWLGIAIAWSGGIILVLKYLDFLLSDGAKKWIRKTSEDLWLYLAAGYATYRFLSTLKLPVLQASIATTVYFRTYYDVTDFRNSKSLIYFLAMMGVGLIVHPFIALKAIRLLGDPTNRTTFFKTLAVATVTSMIIFMLGELFGLSYLPQCYWNITIEPCENPVWQYFSAPIMGEIWAVVVLYFSIILWVLVSVAGWILMFSARHVLFQIATHKDGPVMGLAAFLGLVGGLLQFWAAE